MNTRGKRVAKRIVAALLLAGGLGACVYDPYYAGHAYPGAEYGYSTYAYPAYGYYVGPPVSLNLGYYGHRHHGAYHGKHHGHGWRGHGHGHGWRGHGGAGHRGGWGHRGGRN